MIDDLNPIFQRIKKLHVQWKDLEEPSPKKVKCLCDGHTGYFIDYNLDIPAFALCPSCNPTLHCRKCDGTGHVKKFDLESRKDHITPHACSCTQLSKNIDKANLACIPSKYLDAEFCSLDRLSLKIGNQLESFQAQKIFEAQTRVESFCESLPATQDAHIKPFLTLMGPVGTGKTYLAIAALKYLIFNRNFSAYFGDFQRILGLLREAYTKKVSEASILRPIFYSDILVIDEFGKIRTENEWQLEKLDEIINVRYNQNKITILTTNYLPPHIQYEPQVTKVSPYESFWNQSLVDRVGQRMYDRIFENSYFVDFNGIPSIRQLKNAEFVKFMLQKYDKKSP